jgi:hypothetical protein
MSTIKKNPDKDNWGNWRAWGKSFAREVDGLWLRSSTSTFGELAKGLRQIRKKYLAGSTGNAMVSLEIKRRISENALEFALSHRCQLTVCRRKFKECASFGFTDSSREAYFRLLYAESIAKRGHHRAARAMVLETIRLLNLNSKGKKLVKSHAQTYRKWAGRIVGSLETKNIPTS